MANTFERAWRHPTFNGWAIPLGGMGGAVKYRTDSRRWEGGAYMVDHFFLKKIGLFY